MVYEWGPGAVAKVPRPSTPDAWIEFEARYATSVHGAGAPAPRCLGIERLGRRSVAIYERVHGPTMWEVMIAEPRSAREFARTMADVHLHLFSLVPPVTLPLHVDRVAAKIRNAASRFEPSLLDALAATPRGVTAGEGLRLCHGDLHPGNIILTSDGPVLIDWFDASRGDADADIARTTLLLSGGPTAAPPRHLPGGTPAMLTDVRESYLDVMVARRGTRVDRLERWAAVLAVSRLAEGVPSQDLLGIWHRWRDAG